MKLQIGCKRPGQTQFVVVCPLFVSIFCGRIMKVCGLDFGVELWT